MTLILSSSCSLHKIAKRKSSSIYEAKSPKDKFIMELDSKMKKRIASKNFLEVTKNIPEGMKLCFYSMYGEHKLSSIGLGHHIQEYYLSSVLKFVFKNAEFHYNVRVNEFSENPGYIKYSFGKDCVPVPIVVVDAAIDNEPILEKFRDLGTYFLMSFLKPLQSLAVNETNQEIVELYHGRKHLHLYTGLSRIENHEEFISNFIDQKYEHFKRKYNFNTLTLTLGATENIVRPLSKQYSKNSSDYYLLSDLLQKSRKKPDLNDNMIIFNDTMGLVRDIHKLSDLTMIVGPMNIFESPAQGTPTVFIKDKLIYLESGTVFNKDVLDWHISIVESLKHFKIFDSLSFENYDFTSLIESRSDSIDTFAYRGHSRQDLGQDVLDVYLNHIFNTLNFWIHRYLFNNSIIGFDQSIVPEDRP